MLSSKGSKACSRRVAVSSFEGTDVAMVWHLRKRFWRSKASQERLRESNSSFGGAYCSALWPFEITFRTGGNRRIWYSHQADLVRAVLERAGTCKPEVGCILIVSNSALLVWFRLVFPETLKPKPLAACPWLLAWLNPLSGASKFHFQSSQFRRLAEPPLLEE